MEAYIGHIITAAGMLVVGGIAWGVLRTQVSSTADKAKDHEDRLRDIERFKPTWDTHISDSKDVLERLRGVEGALREMQLSVVNQGKADDRLTDALAANNIVLGDMAEKLVRLETLLERNGH